jgi:hypothetical protein
MRANLDDHHDRRQDESHEARGGGVNHLGRRRDGRSGSASSSRSTVTPSKAVDNALAADS